MNVRPKLIKIKESKSLKDMILQINITLDQIVPEQIDIDELNLYTYSAALLAQRKITPWNREQQEKSDNKRQFSNTPPWKKKLQKQINTLRAEVTQMEARGPFSKKTKQKERKN